jgi:hypothetical protein
MSGWIGVDLDGTLAEHYWPHKGPFDPTRIGEPIAPMVSRVRYWIGQGIEVRIFTARVGPMQPGTFEETMEDNIGPVMIAIWAWTLEHIGVKINATCMKDYAMIELWDRPRTNEQGCEPYATIADPDGVSGSLTADAPRAFSGESVKRVGIVVRSGDAAPNDSRMLDDDDVLPSMTAFHGNEASKLEGCRNPSLLEMQRAHSISDTWDWGKTTKTDRGKMIANSWPIGMGAAVLRAMLIAMGAAKENVA